MQGDIGIYSGNYETFLEDLLKTEKGREALGKIGVLKYPYLNSLIKETLNSVEKKQYKTNITSIDNFYNGGLKPELYVIGAEPGVGKTTLALQLADGLAVNNYDIAYFSLEMSADEMVTKSLSRMSYTKNITLDEYDYSNIEPFTYESFSDVIHNVDKSNISNLIQTYELTIYPKVNFIYCREFKPYYTLKNVEMTIINYTRYHNTKPVIIIDYLQLLRLNDDVDEGNGIRLDTSEIVKQLKQYSKKYNVPIIVISSLNRASYRIGKKNQDELGLDCFKETGGIEYTADNLLVIVPQSNINTSEDTMFLDLFILKNRHGKKNVKLPFIFNGAYSYYQELES